MTDTDSKACPYCAETIKAAAIICRYCGRDLPGPAPAAQAAYQPAATSSAPLRPQTPRAVQWVDGALEIRIPRLRWPARAAPSAMVVPVAAPPEATTTAPITKRGVNWLGIGITAIVAVLLVFWLLRAVSDNGGIGRQQTCAEQSPEFVKTLQVLQQEWQDTLKLADNTPRAGLSPLIASLQDLRRRTQAVDAPECGKAAQAAFVAAMDAAIDGFTAFLAQEPDEVVNAKFAAMGRAVTRATEEIAKMGAPPEP